MESQIVKHCKQISFQFFLQMLVFSIERTSYGRWFHILGVVTRKARSANSSLVRGTYRLSVVAELDDEMTWWWRVEEGRWYMQVPCRQERGVPVSKAYTGHVLLPATSANRSPFWVLVWCSHCVWSRSVRTRAGSLHMKTTSTTFQLSRENGDLKSSATLTGATDVRKMDEFDIKILQQKRHEAEVKR